jgi:hypothetical protein
MHTIFLLEKQVKKPPGRPRRRWEVNIRMDLWEIGWEGAEWIQLAQIGTSCGLL